MRGLENLASKLMPVLAALSLTAAAGGKAEAQERGDNERTRRDEIIKKVNECIEQCSGEVEVVNACQDDCFEAGLVKEAEFCKEEEKRLIKKPIKKRSKKMAKKAGATTAVIPAAAVAVPAATGAAPGAETPPATATVAVEAPPATVAAGATTPAVAVPGAAAPAVGETPETGAARPGVTKYLATGFTAFPTDSGKPFGAGVALGVNVPIAGPFAFNVSGGFGGAGQLDGDGNGGSILLEGAVKGTADVTDSFAVGAGPRVIYLEGDPGKVLTIAELSAIFRANVGAVFVVNVGVPSQNDEGAPSGLAVGAGVGFGWK